MCAATFDQAKAEAFGERMLAVLNHAGVALMTSLGHRTGLFDTMDGMPPATTHEIAAAAGLNERYVREWLGTMVTAGIVEFDPAAQTYRLPAEHAASLTRAASPNNMASVTQWIAVLGGVEDRVVEAFSHGRGVPYSAYARFHQVMAEESSQSVVAGLQEHILPLVPGLVEQLQAGIDVLDVGCGSGWALIHLAETFPASRFVGYDFSAEGIAAGEAIARERGLSNVRLAVQDAAAMDDRAAFDLVTAFDAIHDQARPDQVLANIARALRESGVFLMQDIRASSHVHHNVDLPLGPFTYAISCMHCMSVSLAEGGMGLGAAWGQELALEMLAQAGFGQTRVETLPHDVINYYYVARRQAPASD